MTRKTLFLTIAILGLFNLTSTAQLQNGTVAPDFSITDIEGNNHQLYPLIDQGKTVVLSFFWTIDPVSWGNHSQGYLNDIWDQRGPNGTDDYFVIGIEGIGSTSLEDLNGTGSSTNGDWISGTPYPMVNLEAENTLLLDYEVSFYPLYYVICPEDTTVRVISSFTFENLTSNSGCAQPTTSVADEIKKNSFSIYPNPTSDYMQLTLPEGISKDSQFTLTNSVGEVIFTQNVKELSNNRLPVNHLPKGIYLATIYTDKYVISERVCLQ